MTEALFWKLVAGLQVVLLLLKLFGVVHWSWLLVLSPTIGPVTGILLFFIVAAVGTLMMPAND